MQNSVGLKGIFTVRFDTTGHYMCVIALESKQLCYYQCHMSTENQNTACYYAHPCTALSCQTAFSYFPASIYGRAKHRSGSRDYVLHMRTGNEVLNL